MLALFGKFRKTLGLAVGTRVNSPTAAIIGEAGPEIVAPEKDFMTYSRELITAFSTKLNNVFRMEYSAKNNTLSNSSLVEKTGFYEKLTTIHEIIARLLEKVQQFFTNTVLDKSTLKISDTNIVSQFVKEIKDAVKIDVSDLTTFTKQNNFDFIHTLTFLSLVLLFMKKVINLIFQNYIISISFCLSI